MNVTQHSTPTPSQPIRAALLHPAIAPPSSSPLPLPLLVSLCAGCGGKSDHLNVTLVTANMWPPAIGQDLSLNITGVLDKTETDGQWTVSAKVDGIPVPSVGGDISTFQSTPWNKGAFSLSYSVTIPSILPSGDYSARVVASDQDKEEIFCATLSFSMAQADSFSRLRHALSRALAPQPL